VYRRLGVIKAVPRAGNYSFSYGKGNKNRQLGTGFFVHHRKVAAVRKKC
jgi:hypothetical protein